VAAVAAASDTGLPLVAYTLHIEALPPNIISAVSEVLVDSNSNNPDLDTLKKIYDLTGPDFWTTSGIVAPVAVSPDTAMPQIGSTFAPREGFKPELPSLGEYLKDPQNLGRKYSAERVVSGDAYRLEALICPEENRIRFESFRADSEDWTTWRSLEVWEVHGSLPKTAAFNVLEKDLSAIACQTLGVFETSGAIDPPKRKLTNTESHFIPLESDHVRLSSGASINLSVADGKVVLALGSRALDSQTLQNPQATVCKWTFHTQSDQDKRSLYPELSRLMLLLSAEHAPSAVHNALKRLLNMGANFEETTTAPISAVIPRGLKAHVKSLEGLRIAKPSGLLFGIQDFENVLKGVHQLLFSLDNSQALRQYPQIFNRANIFVKPDGSLELILKNRMHNSIKVSFSKRTVLPTAANVENNPASHILAIIGSAFTKQLKNGVPCSEGRRNLLAILKEFQKRDPQCNSFKELGASRLPKHDDKVGHALLDAVAAPLLRHYVTISKDRYTESHAKSPGQGELTVSIGDRFHPYQLSISSLDNVVSGITITPRKRLSDGEFLLNHGKALNYGCHLKVDQTESAKVSLDILKKVVSEFWKLLDYRHASHTPAKDRLTASGLLKLLDDPSGPFKRL
jgi:hypothetical protein